MTEIGRIPNGNEALRTEAVGRAAGRTDSGARQSQQLGIDRGHDSVDVSDVARAAASRFSADDEIRHDLVERVRGEIESGEYESPVKVAAAIDTIIDSLS